MVKCTKKQIGELKTALRWKMPAAQRQRIQMVLLRESGMTQPAIAEAMGVSLSTVVGSALSSIPFTLAGF
jgi:Homeodomain-like domain